MAARSDDVSQRQTSKTRVYIKKKARAATSKTFPTTPIGWAIGMMAVPRNASGFHPFPPSMSDRWQPARIHVRHGMTVKTFPVFRGSFLEDDRSPNGVLTELPLSKPTGIRGKYAADSCRETVIIVHPNIFGCVMQRLAGDSFPDDDQ